jgi:hypothetical protein
MMLELLAVLMAAQITAGERQRAADELESSRKALVTAVQGLSAEQWSFKPGPERWSIAECVQHIAAAEDGYFALVGRLLARPATPERAKEVAGKDDYVLREMQNRDNKRVTVDALLPGKWKNGPEALTHFGASRDRLIGFVQSTAADLRAHQQEHRAVGLIDAYQWILLASGHVRRHTLQIEEVKRAPRYPQR